MRDTVEEMEVDEQIVKLILPKCYQIIDELLSCSEPPKDLWIRAKQMLPKGYKHSFVKDKK